MVDKKIKEYCEVILHVDALNDYIFEINNLIGKLVLIAPTKHVAYIPGLKKWR